MPAITHSLQGLFQSDCRKVRNKENKKKILICVKNMETPLLINADMAKYACMHVYINCTPCLYAHKW